MGIVAFGDDDEDARHGEFDIALCPFKGEAIEPVFVAHGGGGNVGDDALIILFPPGVPTLYSQGTEKVSVSPSSVLIVSRPLEI